jgi:hypothetical protein
MNMTVFVGWVGLRKVERSDTHRNDRLTMMGIALLNPSYGAESCP